MLIMTTYESMSITRMFFVFESTISIFILLYRDVDRNVEIEKETCDVMFPWSRNDTREPLTRGPLTHELSTHYHVPKML